MTVVTVTQDGQCVHMHRVASPVSFMSHATLSMTFELCLQTTCSSPTKGLGPPQAGPHNVYHVSHVFVLYLLNAYYHSLQELKPLQSQEETQAAMTCPSLRGRGTLGHSHGVALVLADIAFIQ